MDDREEKRRLEKAVFEAFLKVNRMLSESLASDPQPGNDPPDVVTTHTDGHTVDWEITEWLHPEQMETSRTHKQMAGLVLDALGNQGSPPVGIATCQLYLKAMHPKPDALSGRTTYKRRFKEADAEQLRREIRILSEQVSARSEETPPQVFTRQGPGLLIVQGDVLHQSYRTLAEYFSQIHFILGTRRNKVDWIWVATPGHSYDEEQAIAALIRRIESKNRAEWPSGTCLLVYYHMALAHNSPAYSSPESNARRAAECLQGRQLKFEQIYLFFWGWDKAFEIYPQLTECASI